MYNTIPTMCVMLCMLSFTIGTKGCEINLDPWKRNDREQKPSITWGQM